MTETASRILIVDDDRRNLALMEALLKHEGYVTATATGGEKALYDVKSFQPDLILLDIMMPGMDGCETAGRLKQDPDTKTIPIIMVTALDDRNSKLRALNMGAEEFLTKPVDRAELWVRVRNLLRLREYNKFLRDHNKILDEQVQERTAQLTESYLETIHSLNRAAAHLDEDTGWHVLRVSHYCTAIAESLGMDAEFRDCIFYASPMHDIGKIAIPDHILLKPDGFTPEEWAIMKSHTELGAKMLEGSKSPYIRMGREIALSHHERWDGTGYPQGLRGEQIPLPARIMQLADVYDALRSPRSYKPPLSHEKSVEIIVKGDDRTKPDHFDPAVLRVFRRMTARFSEIYEIRQDQVAAGTRVAA